MLEFVIQIHLQLRLALHFEMCKQCEIYAICIVKCWNEANFYGVNKQCLHTYVTYSM